jgi:asparagine synthase (glutamine-hydrolysing)
VGFGSELDYARLVARQFATRHTELLVSADDLMQHLPKLIEHGDAPVAEASNIPIYLVSRKNVPPQGGLALPIRRRCR